MDIEGTTSSISFVHETLFPYSAKRLGSFLKEKNGVPVVNAILSRVAETLLAESKEGTPSGELDLVECEAALLKWIREDRKHPALKELQGLIWREGYESGAYKGHVYPDVLPNWKKWKASGLALGIYSSGSVEAQKQIFGYSEVGDLTSYLSNYFDTRVGPKKEMASYTRIASELALHPEAILFLSDVPAELDAAREAGVKTTHLLRPGTPPGQGHPSAKTFDEVLV
ncbi:MAG: acireductone synthase [Spirochaetia bacterium]|nr:acireductone synthase [Spirochaetia bacterium]